ncbi:MAG TPA: hypothetical protein VIZ20_21645 [Streptosporangiaceae bacterium]
MTATPCELRTAGSPAGCAVPAHLVPVPPGAARLRPAEALERLAGELPGGTRTTLRTDGVLAVLSTPAASVWSNGRIFWWATADSEITWPAADAEGAAWQLSEH